ncbi:MAG: hypothetical protein QNL92_10600 [Octadecabacter sp.]
MKKTLTLLAATAALTAAIAAPVWSAMRTGDSPVQPFAAVLEFGQDAMPLFLASGDDDDDDDDDHDCEYGSDESHDDDDCGGSAGNAAPAGTTAPPQNGLFGNGTPPVVQMN